MDINDDNDDLKKEGVEITGSARIDPKEEGDDIADNSGVSAEDDELDTSQMDYEEVENDNL